MVGKHQTTSKKQSSNLVRNTLETIKDFGSSTVKNTFDSVGNIGNGVMDQMFGFPGENADYFNNEFSQGYNKQEHKPKKKEVNLFNFQEHYETKIIHQQIKELTEQIKREIQVLKKTDASLLQEVVDIEKIALESGPSKVGMYHVRFLEAILRVLQTIRLKMNESKTWLQAMVSKKKKRGSLFASLSKKKGTSFSLSQELQSARSVQ